MLSANAFARKCRSSHSKCVPDLRSGVTPSGYTSSISERGLRSEREAEEFAVYERTSNGANGEDDEDANIRRPSLKQSYGYCERNNTLAKGVS